MSEDQTANTTRAVLSGLSYLHSKDITHRDIKVRATVMLEATDRWCEFPRGVREGERDNAEGEENGEAEGEEANITLAHSSLFPCRHTVFWCTESEPTTAKKQNYFFFPFFLSPPKVYPKVLFLHGAALTHAAGGSRRVEGDQPSQTTNATNASPRPVRLFVFPPFAAAVGA